MSESSLIYQNHSLPAYQAGTHVFIVGVGHYVHGKGTLPASAVAGDLSQLSSPTISARAIADWFIRSYHHPAKPLATVSMLLSADPASSPIYQPPRPEDAAAIHIPRATFENVKAEARQWVQRLSGHKDSMAVFYFCGHGLSQGDNASLLLEDFGAPGREYDGAINLTTLCGTMKNLPAVQQAYFVDCCRTSADDLYLNESDIGSRIASVPWASRQHNTPAQQFVLFPTIDGEEAFGVRDQVSVFTRSIIDAMSFAGADLSTGAWRTTTADLLKTVDKLVALRLPPQLIDRSKPNALDASSFEFNAPEEPSLVRSFVSLSDSTLWGEVELGCADPTNAHPPQNQHSKDVMDEKCCKFDLQEGRWRFSGTHTPGARNIKADERTLRLPVTYVKLEVQP